MKSVLVVLLVFFVLIPGCAAPGLSPAVVSENFEAVAVPYLRYVEADAEMRPESKEIRRLQVEKFRKLVKKAMDEEGQ